MIQYWIIIIIGNTTDASVTKPLPRNIIIITIIIKIMIDHRRSRRRRIIIIISKGNNIIISPVIATKLVDNN